MLSAHAKLASSTQSDGLTPLFYASKFGHTSIVKLLLEEGADPNLYVKRWWMEPTCIHAATMRGHIDVVKLLLNAGANINCRNEHLYTPLITASRWNHLETAHYLLENGADPNLTDNNGMRAVTWAGDQRLELKQLLEAYS